VRRRVRGSRGWKPYSSQRSTGPCAHSRLLRPLSIQLNVFVSPLLKIRLDEQMIGSPRAIPAPACSRIHRRLSSTRHGRSPAHIEVRGAPNRVYKLFARHVPTEQIRCFAHISLQGGKFDCEDKGAFTHWNWSQRRRVESLSRNISRSTGEDRIGRKPFLHRGRGKSILTQSPERFGP
jgi:hypothetical protein